jgi:hypothetical protein
MVPLQFLYSIRYGLSDKNRKKKHFILQSLRVKNDKVDSVYLENYIIKQILRKLFKTGPFLFMHKTSQQLILV